MQCLSSYYKIYALFWLKRYLLICQIRNVSVILNLGASYKTLKIRTISTCKASGWMGKKQLIVYNIS